MRRATLLSVALVAGACSTFGSGEPNGVTNNGEDASTDANVLGDGGTSDVNAQTDGGGSSPHIAFITSAAYAGNEVADKKCNEAVEGTPLAGRTFKAWIFDGTNAAKSRLRDYGPWHTMGGDGGDGGRVAKNLDSLFATLEHPINIDELGVAHGDEYVWTGTDSNGAPQGYSCDRWTSVDASVYGWCGLALSVDSTWMGVAPAACPENHRLYCFEQPPL